MNKKTMTLISFILILSMMITLVPTAGADNSAAAAADRYLIGDADGDKELTILDATAIQRKLADLRKMTELDEFLADVDGDDELTILDATAIQRKLADLGNSFWTNTVLPRTPIFTACAASTQYPNRENNSHRAYVGTEVTITYNTYTVCLWKYILSHHDISMNCEKNVEDTEEKQLTYTFDHPGEYVFVITAKNMFGLDSSRTVRINVIESPEHPYIADAEYNSSERTIRAKAQGGAGDYLYKYYIRYYIPEAPSEAPTETPTAAPGDSTDAPTAAPTEAPTAADPSYHFEPKPDGNYEIISEYSEADYVIIPEYMLNSNFEYTFYVSAIDKNGVESPMSVIRWSE